MGTGWKIGLGVVGLAVCATVVWWIWLRAPSAPSIEDVAKLVPDESVPVSRGDIRRVVTASGRVIARQEVRMKCKASGQIIELPFNLSDRVKKGDLVARLDPADEERNTRKAKVALDISRSRLETAKLNYEIAKQTLSTEKSRATSSIASAQVKLGDLQADLKRGRQLFEKSLISGEELEKAQVAEKQGALALETSKLRLEELKTSEAALMLKKNEVDVAKGQVETDELKLLDAEQRMKDLKVYAPIDGAITNLFVRPGQIVSSGTSSTTSGTDLLDIIDLSTLYTDVNVDEADVGGIREGLAAEITTDASNGAKYAGKVHFVSPKGSRSRGVVNFTVRIEILEKENPSFRPEMSTSVEIILEERKNVLLLPLPAVRTEGNKHYVEVPAGEGKKAKREVKVGLKNGAEIEIVSGLAEGDKVVLSLSPTEAQWVSQMLDKKSMTQRSTAGQKKK